jgi:hypothetical protein
MSGEGRNTHRCIRENIGENTLRPISFLQQGLQVARSIAYIGLGLAKDAGQEQGFL